MTSSKPRLSIGVPVYNGEHYIAEALTSHLEQDFGDFEIVISDNCSDDGTADIVHEFVASDSRVSYSRNDENIGGPANFNRLFRLTDGELFRWAAADDRIEPGYLSNVIAMMDADPSIVIGHSESLLIDPQSRPMLEMDQGWLGGDGYMEAIRLSPPPGDERFHSEQPHHRIDAVINNNHRHFYIFGVMRRDVMFQTKLHGPFYGGDRTLLVEMAMRGRLQEVHAPALRISEPREELRSQRPQLRRAQTTWRKGPLVRQPGDEGLRQRYRRLTPRVRGTECLAVVAKKFKQPTRMFRGW